MYEQCLVCIVSGIIEVFATTGDCEWEVSTPKPLDVVVELLVFLRNVELCMLHVHAMPNKSIAQIALYCYIGRVLALIIENLVGDVLWWNVLSSKGWNQSYYHFVDHSSVFEFRCNFRFGLSFVHKFPVANLPMYVGKNWENIFYWNMPWVIWW